MTIARVALSTEGLLSLLATANARSPLFQEKKTGLRTPELWLGLRRQKQVSSSGTSPPGHPGHHLSRATREARGRGQRRCRWTQVPLGHSALCPVGRSAGVSSPGLLPLGLSTAPPRGAPLEGEEGELGPSLRRVTPASPASAAPTPQRPSRPPPLPRPSSYAKKPPCTPRPWAAAAPPGSR